MSVGLGVGVSVGLGVGVSVGPGAGVMRTNLEWLSNCTSLGTPGVEPHSEALMLPLPTLHPETDTVPLPVNDPDPPLQGRLDETDTRQSMPELSPEAVMV